MFCVKTRKTRLRIVLGLAGISPAELAAAGSPPMTSALVSMVLRGARRPTVRFWKAWARCHVERRARQTLRRLRI